VTARFSSSTEASISRYWVSQLREIFIEVVSSG
jgi:hypothetical protein